MTTIARRKAQRKYRNSPKGKAAIRAYRNSPRGKAVIYDWERRYRNSPKAKKSAKKSGLRYRNSPKGKSTRSRYRQSLKSKNARYRYSQKPEVKAKVRIQRIRYWLSHKNVDLKNIQAIIGLKLLLLEREKRYSSPTGLRKSKYKTGAEKLVAKREQSRRACCRYRSTPKYRRWYRCWYRRQRRKQCQRKRK